MENLKVQKKYMVFSQKMTQLFAKTVIFINSNEKTKKTKPKSDIKMCGIIGYSGRNKAKQIILEGLKKLEHREYDSCGICLVNGKDLYIYPKL